MRTLPILLAACTARAPLEPGSYGLVGARTSAEVSMTEWDGDHVTLTVGDERVTLGDLGFAVTPQRRRAWVEGCWTMQGGTLQEWWSLDCDGPIDLGEDVVVACPLALLAVCPDGDEVVIRDVPDENGGSGCGTSGVCLQFRP